MSLNEAPERIFFAAGDYLVRYPLGSEYQLMIDSPIAKPGWKPRKILPPPVFPGSALEFEGQYYEVVKIEIADKRYFYYLNPWDARFPLRVQFHYSAGECERLVEQIRRRKESDSIRALLRLFSPIVGMLSSRTQISLQNQYGISARQLTLISGLCGMLIGVFCLLMLLSKLSGGTVLQIPALVLIAGCYLLGESIIRIYQSVKLEEPMGSLFFTLPAEIFQTITRKDTREVRPRIPRAEWIDKVTICSNQEYDLEILSILPKTGWNQMTGIQYGGVWYGLVGSDVVGDEKNRKYRFLLKRATEGTFFRNAVDFKVDDVFELLVQKRKRDLGTWVETFAPFWGLLDRHYQKSLESIYGFRALKFTGWSILALVLLGASNLIASIANYSYGLSTGADAIWLIVSAYLLFENYFRYQDYRKGEPCGSILGKLFEPFAKRLIDLELK